MLSLNSQEMIDSQTSFEDTCSTSADSPFIVRFIAVIDSVFLVDKIDEDAARSHRSRSRSDRRA